MNIFKRLTMKNAHRMNPNKAAKRLATKSARKAIKLQDQYDWDNLDDKLEEQVQVFETRVRELEYLPRKEI